MNEREMPISAPMTAAKRNAARQRLFRTLSDLKDIREQRKQPNSEGIETARHALRAAQFNTARAAEVFLVDEVLVTPGRLYFCGRLSRIVIKA
jgi:hypothetical protein